MKKYLRIKPPEARTLEYMWHYGQMLGQLAVAEAILAKKDNKAMDHFIAVVKELERVFGFSFYTAEEGDGGGEDTVR